MKLRPSPQYCCQPIQLQPGGKLAVTKHTAAAHELHLLIYEATSCVHVIGAAFFRHGTPEGINRNCHVCDRAALHCETSSQFNT